MARPRPTQRRALGQVLYGPTRTTEPSSNSDSQRAEGVGQALWDRRFGIGRCAATESSALAYRRPIDRECFQLYVDKVLVQLLSPQHRPQTISARPKARQCALHSGRRSLAVLLAQIFARPEPDRAILHQTQALAAPRRQANRRGRLRRHRPNPRDYVLPPQSVTDLAAKCGLPRNVPLVKYLAALPATMSAPPMK